MVKMTEKEWDDKWEFVLGNCHLLILLLFSVTFILKFWMFFGEYHLVLVVFGEFDLAIAFVINDFPVIINVVQKWKGHTRNIPQKGAQNPRKGKKYHMFVLSSILL